MSGVMRYDFRLFGPRKGQTVRINGHQFVNGVLNITQSSDNMGACARVFSFYSAFARGTPEYDEALSKEESENGTDKVSTDALTGTDSSVQAGIQPDGRGPTPEAADASDGGASPQRANGSSSNSSGDGHQHTRIPQFPEDKDFRSVEPSSEINSSVEAAIRKLDPEVDSQWVLTGAHKGKPKLQAVEEAYGKAGLTRQDLESAMPGYTRENAYASALAI